MEREKALWCVFPEDINSIISGPHIYDPITFMTILWTLSPNTLMWGVRAVRQGFNTCIGGGYKDSGRKRKVLLHLFLLPRRWVRLQNLASSYFLGQNLFAFMLDQNHFVTEVTERELKALKIILCTQFQKLTEGTPSIGLISRGFIFLRQHL